MCDFCKSPLDAYRISGRDKKFCLCPNCTAEKIYANDFPKFDDALLTVTIDSFSGPLCIVMSPDESIRFLGHQLMPDEYKKYHDRYGDIFELHDDFYFDTGIAYQPVDSTAYLYDLLDKYDDVNTPSDIKESIRYAFNFGIVVDDENYSTAASVAPVYRIKEINNSPLPLTLLIDKEHPLNDISDYDVASEDANYMLCLDIEKRFQQQKERMER